MFREMWQRDDAQSLPEYAFILIILLMTTVALATAVSSHLLPALEKAAHSVGH